MLDGLLMFLNLTVVNVKRYTGWFILRNHFINLVKKIFTCEIHFSHFRLHLLLNVLLKVTISPNLKCFWIFFQSDKHSSINCDVSFNNLSNISMVNLLWNSTWEIHVLFGCYQKLRIEIACWIFLPNINDTFACCKEEISNRADSKTRDSHMQINSPSLIPLQRSSFDCMILNSILLFLQSMKNQRMIDWNTDHIWSKFWNV